MSLFATPLDTRPFWFLMLDASNDVIRLVFASFVTFTLLQSMRSKEAREAEGAMALGTLGIILGASVFAFLCIHILLSRFRKYYEYTNMSNNSKRINMEEREMEHHPPQERLMFIHDQPRQTPADRFHSVLHETVRNNNAHDLRLNHGQNLEAGMVGAAASMYSGGRKAREAAAHWRQEALLDVIQEEEERMKEEAIL